MSSRRTAPCASRVADHGPGIPYDQQRLIFEKFGRADVPGASKPGSGLGLFIARSIAEAHGGTLEVQLAARCGRDVRADAAGTLVGGLCTPAARPRSTAAEACLCRSRL